MFDNLTPQDVTTITAAIAAFCALVMMACLLLVRKSVRLVEDKFHVKVPAQVVAGLESVARMAAGAIEERIRKFALGLIPSAPQTPQEKIDAAVEVARSLAPDGLADYSHDQIATAVESQLPSIRPVVEAAAPIQPGSKSLVPLSIPSLVPASPRIPSELGPTTFLDTDVETSPQTPKAKRGE